MRLLHDIQSAGITAYIWSFVRGGNGRELAGQWMAHLWRVTRTTPPENRRHRQYWAPWSGTVNNLTNDERLTPLCGRIRSRARYPRLETVYTDSLWPTYCQNCRDLAAASGITPNFLNRVATSDPWYNQRTAHRDEAYWELPDPVTGL